MKRLTDCTVCRKLSEGLRALGEYSVGGEYDVTLSLYADEAGHSPEYSCRRQGSGRQKLWRLLAIVGAAALVVSLIRRLCSLISG